MMEKPKYYVTPTEFAGVVIAAMEEIGYFKKDELAHPEDIAINFTSVAQAVAAGMGYAGRKMI